MPDCVLSGDESIPDGAGDAADARPVTYAGEPMLEVGHPQVQARVVEFDSCSGRERGGRVVGVGRDQHHAFTQIQGSVDDFQRGGAVTECRYDPTTIDTGLSDHSAMITTIGL
ncbi:hypothetical protein [Nocardia sp. CNY236]|uniref:hypothetical protein n=1 Tax=Nocardia sp. CNY236 TaxID=1169152 RepID=UPI0018C9DBB6|nr:hypothetical protein [Nocardia sp. CNY236]